MYARAYMIPTLICVQTYRLCSFKKKATTESMTIFSNANYFIYRQ